MKAVFRMLWLSLKVRLRLTSAWSWLFIAVGAVLVPMISSSLGRLVGSSSTEPQDLLPFLTGFLNLILFMQIGVSFSSAFYHLYLSRDLPLLLASPSRPRSVILAKMLEVAGSGVLTYVAAGVPLLVSLGVVWYAPSWYYVLATLAGLPFAVLPAVLAILANLAVCRILPPYRSKEITAALGTLVGALTYLFFRVAGSSTIWSRTRDPSAVSLLFGKLGPSWSPSVLLARAVIEGLCERWLPLLMSGVLLSTAVLILFALFVGWTERAYLSGWAASREGRRGRKTRWTPGGAHDPALHPPGHASEHALRPTSGHTSHSYADYARPVRVATGAAQAPLRHPFMSVELKALSVESKLLFRDLQSQSQVLYVVIMVLAMQLFPRRHGSPVENQVFSLAPFFFLTVSGSYASWSLKNMSVTARMLRQFPCDPTRVMRGKAFFYGIVQSGCIVLLIAVLKAFGRFALGSLPVLGTLWISLSFATAGASVAAAAHKPEISQSTGIPRLELGASIALFLVSAALAAISAVAYMIGLARSMRSPGADWAYTGLAVAVNAVAFVVATNVAGNMIKGTSPTERSEVGGSK